MHESAGLSNVVSDSFNRTADTTAYASGDLVANDVTAGSVAPMTFRVARDKQKCAMLLRARLVKSDVGVTNAAFRLHLFRTAPTVANGDNGAFSPNNAANYLGYFDFTAMTAFSDDAHAQAAPAVGSSITVRPVNSTDIYGLLEARGAYTPASGETFTVSLEVLQD